MCRDKERQHTYLVLPISMLSFVFVGCLHRTRDDSICSTLCDTSSLDPPITSLPQFQVSEIMSFSLPHSVLIILFPCEIQKEWTGNWLKRGKEDPKEVGASTRV